MINVIIYGVNILGFSIEFSDYLEVNQIIKGYVDSDKKPVVFLLSK